MARLTKVARGASRKILVIDDDEVLLASAVRLLAQEGHDVRGETRPEAGIELLRTFRPDVLLLDYFMNGTTGADVVRAIRAFDTMVQVILVTGYASETPARRMLAELDIQGYHDKTDGPQRLLVLLDAALKHHAALSSLDYQRRALRHILDVAGEIGKLGPHEHLFRAAIENVGALLHGGDGFIATENHGFFVMNAAREGVGVRAGTGQFSTMTCLSSLPAAAASAAIAGLSAKVPQVHPDGFILIPLLSSAGDCACLVIEGEALAPEAIEPCRIYARQVMQAFENLVLFERATVDPLTELYNRSFGLQRFEEVLQFAGRQRHDTSVLLIDVDRFKAINDTFGHAGGDTALRVVAGAVRGACRSTDVVSRYGGEEILVVLPATDAVGAALIAERVRAAVASTLIPFDGKSMRVTVSVGYASSAPGKRSSDELIRRADASMYRAKATGRNRVCTSVAPTLSATGST